MSFTGGLPSVEMQSCFVMFLPDRLAGDLRSDVSAGELMRLNDISIQTECL